MGKCCGRLLATACLVLFFRLGGPPLAHAQVPLRPEEWRRLHPEIAADHPLAIRAHEVFERLVSAADVRSRALPSLMIVDGLGYPEALALPGGTIVVSREMVEYCLGGTSALDSDAADARLALVLGHELAHLAFDNGHRAYFSTRELGGRSSAKVLSQSESDGHRRMEEREAEYYGLHFLLRAGFDVDSLLLEGADFWRGIVVAGRRSARETSWQHHPKPEERAELLHTQLAGLEQARPLLEWGQRLVDVGQSAVGLRLLEEYKLSFVGPEVLEAVGVGHLQLAYAEVAACGGGLPGQFRVLLGGSGSAGAPARRLGASRSECLRIGEFRRQLSLGRRALQRAADVQSHGASALVSLAHSYLLEGDLSGALGPAIRARELTPQDPLIQITWAIVWFLLGVEHGIDHSDEPLAILAELGTGVGVHAELARYNEAQMRQQLGDRSQAAAVYASARALRSAPRAARWHDWIWRDEVMEPSSPFDAGVAPNTCAALSAPRSRGLVEPRVQQQLHHLAERRFHDEYFGFYQGAHTSAISHQGRTLALSWPLEDRAIDVVLSECSPLDVIAGRNGSVVFVYADSALELRRDGSAAALAWSPEAMANAGVERCAQP